MNLAFMLLARGAASLVEGCLEFAPCAIVVGGAAVVVAPVVAAGVAVASVAERIRNGRDQAARAAFVDANNLSPEQLSSKRSAIGPVDVTDYSVEGDWVDVSAFSPEVGRARESILVQLFLHPIDQAETAIALAREADPETKRRGITTLNLKIPRLRTLLVTLDAAGLQVAEPVQMIIWRNEARACQFEVEFPDDADGEVYQLRAHIAMLTDSTGDSVPLGSLRFSVRGAARRARLKPGSDIRDGQAQRYQRAFLSYASPDRHEVLKRAQALKTVGIEFFHDLLDLQPGERWERKLYKEIDRCDLFMLFWSAHAADSEWVMREAEYALKRQADSPEEVPEIRPVILEGPPVPRPPTFLQHLHFNDELRYVMCAEEKAQQHVVETHRQAGDQEGEADAFCNIAQAQSSRRRFGSAIESLLQALEMYRVLDDSAGKARALYGIGNIHVTQKRYDEAVNCYGQALELFKEVNDTTNVANTARAIEDVRNLMQEKLRKIAVQSSAQEVSGSQSTFVGKCRHDFIEDPERPGKSLCRLCSMPLR